MKDQEINAAIAEVCGDYICECCKDICKDCVKNYCTDLNAMHEAEKIIRTIKGVTIYDYAARISKTHHYDELLTATARQRAEAFLRVLGKWKDE